MGTTPRVILHIDLDAFFAAAEVLANPSLRGLPVVVGGSPGDRAAVACASYEARALGIQAGMSVSEASRIAPHAVFLPCNPPRYFDLSGRMLQILLRRTPLVESASIDEAYIDAEGLASDLVGGDLLALSIQEEIERKLRLTSSVGVGPNKRVAKAASAERKPRGRTVLDVERFRALFSERPVTALDGVGTLTGDRLAHAGIRKVGQLAESPLSLLMRIVGSRGARLVEAARGEDDSPVVPVRCAADPRSLGHQFTFRRDVGDRETIRRAILALSEKVAWDLRDEGWTANAVHLRVRMGSGEIRHRRCAIRGGDPSPGTIFRAAWGSFSDFDGEGVVRSIGVSVSGLVRRDPGEGTDLFDGAAVTPDRERSFDTLSDSLRSIYGRRVLRRASLLDDAMGRRKP